MNIKSVNNHKNLALEKYKIDVVTTCLTDNCKYCTGSYINRLMKYRLLCKCRCHST